MTTFHAPSRRTSSDPDYLGLTMHWTSRRPDTGAETDREQLRLEWVTGRRML